MSHSSPSPRWLLPITLGLGVALLGAGDPAAMGAAAPAHGGPTPHGAAVAPPPPSPELLKKALHSPADLPFHPAFVLRDAAGTAVATSQGPLNLEKTCGDCHDASWIARHGYHATLGQNETTGLGKAKSGREWDFGPGLYGRWDPLNYGVRAPAPGKGTEAELLAFLKGVAPRHVGGGPAERSPTPGAAGPESLEVNCLLCHLPGADNQARWGEVQAGRFRWAATATLARTGLVRREGEGWEWVKERLEADGRVKSEVLPISPPDSRACGQCHGVVHSSSDPLALTERFARGRETATTGTLFSPQRLSDSAVDLLDKERLSRPWDVHAERLLTCSGCHFTPNNPAHAFQVRGDTPSHLRFDARRLDIGSYLRRPDHNFAKGSSTQGTTAESLDGGMRRCEDCHQPKSTHGWLPKAERHLGALACESCHIPRAYAPALAELDYSLLARPGEPRRVYRGVQGAPTDPVARVEGFRPVLLPRRSADGSTRLFPYNLITSWYWVATREGKSEPVALDQLDRAFFQGKQHHPTLLAALDQDRNGELSDAELVLDSPAKVEAAKARLLAVGVQQPSLRGEIQPHGLHHGVGPSRTATRDCRDCHAEQSRVTEAFTLSQRAPSGVIPTLIGDSNARLEGALLRTQAGGWELARSPDSDGARGAGSVYVLGHSHWAWIDWIGIAATVLAFAGALGHGTLRILGARQRKGKAS